MPNETTTTSTLGAAAAGAAPDPKAGAGAGAAGAGADAGAGAGGANTVDPKVAAAAAEQAAAELAGKPFTDIAHLKLPDGLKADETVMKDFLPLAAKHGLTNAQASALVEFSAKADAARAAATKTAQEAAQKAAVESLKADKEIGGANFDKSIALAGKTLARFGGPELTKALNELQLADGSMLGDSPVIARLLVNIGKGLAEDSISGTNGEARKTASNDPATLHKSLYPNSPGLT